MPGGDRTGPRGQGAMTGRGLGSCSGVNSNMYGRGLGRGLGRGIGFGAGMGLGAGRGFGGYYPNSYAQVSPKEALSEEKSWLENRLSAISEQLNGLPEDNK